MPKAQADSHLPHRFVALDNEFRQERRRAVFYGQRVRETQIVLRDNVRVDQGHHLLPSPAGLLPEC